MATETNKLDPAKTAAYKGGSDICSVCGGVWFANPCNDEMEKGDDRLGVLSAIAKAQMEHLKSADSKDFLWL